MFHCVIQDWISFSKARIDLRTPQRVCLLINSANHCSTRLNQDDPVGVKCRWKRGYANSRASIAGVLRVALLSSTRCGSRPGLHVPRWGTL